ncbi:hypothetical protein [Flavobacterium sp.]|uniref:hypothetical protein n=1 Tax=Flavobacterium sp. TaxID=239 RepID=UPI00286D7956|nr:hypothetical protein [Flavobacterium sp.]
MKAICILAFLFSLSIHSQSKTIVPKKGTVVFNCKEIITDEKLYEISKKELKTNLSSFLKNEIITESGQHNQEIDSLKLKNVLENSEDGYDLIFNNLFTNLNEDYHYHHTFDNNKITYYVTKNDELIGENQTIDLNDKINTRAIEGKNNEMSFINEFAYFDDNDIIEIKEYRNEKRKIKKFNCFKVLISYKETLDDLDFFNSYIFYKELWVSDKIKCLHHPIIKYPMILEKYYPLEITEYSDMQKGIIKEYKIEEISLK